MSHHLLKKERKKLERGGEEKKGEWERKWKGKEGRMRREIGGERKRRENGRGNRGGKYIHSGKIL